VISFDATVHRKSLSATRRILFLVGADAAHAQRCCSPHTLRRRLSLHLYVLNTSNLSYHTIFRSSFLLYTLHLACIVCEFGRFARLVVYLPRRHLLPLTSTWTCPTAAERGDFAKAWEPHSSALTAAERPFRRIAGRSDDRNRSTGRILAVAVRSEGSTRQSSCWADPPLLQLDTMASVKQRLPQRTLHQHHQHHQPTNYSLPLPNPNYNSISPLSNEPSLGAPSPYAVSRDPNIMRQQQYAHPLSRGNEAGATLIQSNGQNAARLSDHYLRRKTPNGVLNAAYDGTSVEQTERPHAMKHILLPVTDHFSPLGMRSVGLGQDVPMVMPMGQMDSPSPYNTPHMRSPMPLDLWGSSYPMTPDTASPWTLGRLSAPMDSVLNQLPIQTAQQLMYPANGLIHGFMPPPVQPPFVPTASGSTQTFGQFWPNQGYQNYIPAATRDLYWNPIQSFPNSGQIANYGGWPMNAGPAPGLNPNFTPTGMFPNTGLALNTHYPSPVGQHQPFPNPPFNAQYQSQQPQPQTPNFAFAPTQPPQSTHYSPLSQGIQNSTNFITPGRSFLSEFGANSENSRNRDRVFEQAVVIYQELVKHLASRSRNPGRSQTLPLRYPKVPRPVQSDPPMAVQRHNSTGNILNDRPPLPNPHRHSFLDGQDHGPRRDMSHQHGNQAWQSESTTPLMRSPPQTGRLLHLRTGADALTHPNLMSLSGHTAQMLYQHAAAYLEKLEIHCQESNWKWIDGLLLGGSMAFAMADYNKAHDWYSKILKVDPW
jgi:hypothetical protein